MRKKHNFTDLTFLIPIRLDSIVRLENLLVSIDVLMRNCHTNIKVLHAAEYDNGLLPKLLGKKVSYEFVEDWDNVFYRTRYLNKMALEASTPFLVIWDADVIIPFDQIVSAVEHLRQGCDIVYPYDGLFFDTSEIIRSAFLKKRDVRLLKRNRAKMGLIYGSNMRGGAIFVNRQKYIQSGMENEDFYGWGPEDFERFSRWEILQYKIHFVPGCLFHLSHSRGDDSKFRSLDQLKDTNSAFLRTKYSSKEEILKRNEENNHERLTGLADLP